MTDMNIHGSATMLLFETPNALRRTVKKPLAFRIPTTAPILIPAVMAGISERESSVLNWLLVKPKAFLIPSSFWFLIMIVFIRSIIVSHMTITDTRTRTMQITLDMVMIGSFPLASSVH